MIDLVTTPQVRTSFAMGAYPNAIGGRGLIAFDIWYSEEIRKAKAEAWQEGFDAAEEDWAHHDQSGWGDEECVDATYNPYTGGAS